MCTQPKKLFYHALQNEKSNNYFPSSRTVLYSGPKLTIMITIVSDTFILVIKCKFVIEKKISCHRYLWVLKCSAGNHMLRKYFKAT